MQLSCIMLASRPAYCCTTCRQYLLPASAACTHCARCSQTPEGQPPDVWRRLPHKALKAALEHYGNAPAYSWDTAGALTSMTRAAAEHSLLLEDETQRLHREVQELRQQQDKQQQEAMLQESKADRLRREVLELRQQQEKQQQEAADLQATVAAMGAQLRRLLLQNSVQKG